MGRRSQRRSCVRHLAADAGTTDSRSRLVARDRLGFHPRSLPAALSAPLVGVGDVRRADGAGLAGSESRATSLADDPCHFGRADHSGHRYRAERRQPGAGHDAPARRCLARCCHGLGRACPGEAALSALIWSPFADEETAAATAATLLDEGLVACANILPPMRSIYVWNGELVERREVGVLFKTDAALLDRATARLAEIHPYEAPAVLGWRTDTA